MSDGKLPDLAATTVTTSVLERDREFDEVVDSEGPIEIRGQPFIRSEVLASDPVAYRQALEEYREERLELLLEAGTERFPHPIAHCLYRYLNSAQTDNERLQFLKDTWEALISVIFSLTVSEVRKRGQPVSITTDQIRDFRRYIDSQSIRHRLEVVRLTYEAEVDLPLLRSIIAPQAVLQMIELNQRRNEDFAHMGTLNERQSASLVSEIEPEVLAILKQTSQLEGIELVRHLGPTRKRSENRFELFVGHGSTRRIELRSLSAEQAVALALTSREDVLALCGGTILPLTPTIVWREGRGHRSELAFLKKRRVEGEQSIFTFEVYGDAVEFESDATELLQDLNAVKALYQTGSGASQ